MYKSKDLHHVFMLYSTIGCYQFVENFGAVFYDIKNDIQQIIFISWFTFDLSLFDYLIKQLGISSIKGKFAIFNIFYVNQNLRWYVETQNYLL